TVLFIIAGCDSVTVNKPFGTQPPKQVIESLSGTWASRDGDVFFVSRTEGDALVAGKTQWEKKNKQFTARNYPLVLRMIGDQPVLFFAAHEGLKDQFGFIWLHSIEDDLIRGRAPKASVWRDAVASGEFDGRVNTRENDHYDVLLESSEKLPGQLIEYGLDRLFEKDAGDPIRRIGK
ncbi:hypothetical protein, partial [Rhodopirellula bahusiensis]|uniref:hypothetical protein n=1 Tax=Rhodopirellula bahusiensis TaxID=2014065 RepID=UPI00329A4E2E